MHHPEDDMPFHSEDDTMLHPEDDTMLHPKDGMLLHSEDNTMLHPEDDMPLHRDDDMPLHPEDDMLHHAEDDTMLHPEDGIMLHQEDDMPLHPEDDMPLHPEVDMPLHPEDGMLLHPEDDTMIYQEAKASVGADQSKFQIQLGCSHLLSTETLDMSTGHSWSPEMSDSGISSIASPTDLDFVNHQENLSFFRPATMDFGMSNYRQLPPACPSDVVPYKLLCGLGHVNLTSNGKYSSRIMSNFVE